LEAFNQDIKGLRKYIDDKIKAGKRVRPLSAKEGEKNLEAFSSRGANAIVFKEDVSVELGNPNTFSMAPVLVTERSDLVSDKAITLIGPDIPEAKGGVPFAQILLLSSSELKDEDYRKLNSFQYELELKGYMIKAMPSALTIWSRVGKESVKAGFSFEILGSAIINSYKSKFKIQSAEIIFITTSEDDVKQLEGLRNKVVNILGAMNKMIEETSYDCSSCEYVDVCNDVRELGKLREELMKRKNNK